MRNGVRAGWRLALSKTRPHGWKNTGASGKRPSIVWTIICAKCKKRSKEMGAGSNPVTEPADRVLVITRLFDAPRELVFKAWTDPEHLVHWMGPRGFTSTVLRSELRPGGAYRIHMAGPEGDDHWTQ